MYYSIYVWNATMHVEEINYLRHQSQILVNLTLPGELTETGGGMFRLVIPKTPNLRKLERQHF